MASDKTKKRHLSHHELSVFCAQMAMLIRSGNSPYDSVSILLGDTTDREGRRILEDMLQTLGTGEKLHTAMEQAGVFPGYVIHMITIGEESGKPDTILDALSDFYDREDTLRETVRSALRYPVIMIAIMFLVIVVLITQVLPIFAQVFAQLGTGMNVFSESLLNFGIRVNRYSLVIIVVLAVLVFALIWLFRSNAGRKRLRLLIDRFPPTGRLSRDIAAGRFANGMALTLSSGMDTYQSLELIRRIVENDTVEHKIEAAKTLIREQGYSFPEAIEKTGIFTQLYSRMVSTGFKSGSMDTTMHQIAEHYEKETDRRIHAAISVVEPTLVILLSLIVGLILLSVIMPLMGIMSNIG